LTSLKLKSPLAFGFLLVALPVFANGLPAYFGTAFFHIMVINLIVMTVEFFLLFRLSKMNVFFRYIILANLFSLFFAYPFTDFFIHSFHIKQWFGLSKSGTIKKPTFLLGASFFILLTIFIEWLFFYLAMKRQTSLKTSLRLSALVNLLTNIPIAVFYILTDIYQPTHD
jgi:hypothetical protein